MKVTFSAILSVYPMDRHSYTVITRKTEVGCNDLAHSRNGSVVLKRAHNGHEANDGIAKAKLAKTSLKERAGVCSKPPRELLFDAKLQFGTIPVGIGSNLLLKFLNMTKS
uniref:Uncharacterized protein n=1 Tax=Caenorhabditis japonica TaxID=281687 RepID=A0A8R1I6F4_CAEJA